MDSLYLQPLNRKYFVWQSSKTKKVHYQKIHCGVEQLVARWAHNPKAVSSSLAPATQEALAFMPGLFLWT